MSHTCIHCGQTGLSYSHSYDNCPAVLARKQNDILQSTLNLHKKQMKAQQRTQEDAENAAARNRKSGLGGTQAQILLTFQS